MSISITPGKPQKGRTTKSKVFDLLAGSDFPKA